MQATWRHHLGMPLLAKELIEQAVRPRTYWVRTIYALILFASGLFIIYGRGASGGVAKLGQGAEMFRQIYQLQLLAILLFLPATCAGAFAGEKERESLSLLLLTTIPRQWIVLQKTLSRVIPMLAFVVLSFPLMATAYSFGGVPTAELYFAFVFLTLLTVYVGMMSIMCSTYCRTTVEAYIASYLCIAFSSVFWAPLYSGGNEILVRLVLSLIVLGPMTLVAFGLACVFLYDRAFVPPKNILLILFKQLDAFFNQANTVTGGVILVRDGDPYPDHDPITWRETTRRSLGTFRYLFRVLVVIEIPVLLVAQLVNLSMQTRSAMTILLYLVWVIALGLTTIHSASVISAERSRQTLDVLLVAPIAGRDILIRKLSGVRRLFWTLMVPFVSIFGFQQWYHGYRMDLRYLALSITSVVVFLRMVMWLGLGIGLKSRSQMRAVMQLLSLLAILVLGGPVMLYALDLAHVSARWLRDGLIASPAVWLMTLEETYPLPPVGRVDHHWPLFWKLLIPLAIYGAVTLVLRGLVLRMADRMLGRVSLGEHVPEE